MGVFDLLFSTSKKIHSSQIDRIPASSFGREVKIVIDGETVRCSGVKLKSILMGMVKNGVTITKLEDDLKDMGLKNDQIERRKEIISKVEENNL